MTSRRFTRYLVPIVYLAIWTVLVAALAAAGLRGSTSLLFADTAVRPQRAAVSQPVPAPASVPAPAPVPVVQKVEAPIQTHARSGRREISNPVFDTSQAGFTCSYDLGVAPQHDCTIRRQNKVAAWMVDVPGQWRLLGPADIAVDHPLIHRVLVLINANRVRFKLYYRDATHRPATQPAVHFTDRGISITVSD